MALSDEAERTIGTTLGGFLVAVASICLSIMAAEKVGSETANNEIFGILGLASLLTAALMIDAILDKANCDFDYRAKTLLNGGYLLFCVILSGISAGIILLYHHQENTVSEMTWILVVASSTSLFLKLMINDDKHVFGPALFFLYIGAFFST